MKKIIAFVLALSLALPFSSGAAFVPEEVEHSAEAEYVLEWADTAFSDDESADITYHFPLDTETYTTPFPLVGVAPHTSILYDSYREWKTTAANTGYVEFPSPTKEIACEKYPYMVLQYKNERDSYNGNIVYYFTTTGDTARDENKTVYSYLATGNTGAYKYQILPLFHNVRYKGFLQNGHMIMRETGAMKITDIFLTDSLDFLTNEPEPDPAVLSLRASDITADGQTVSVYPTLTLPDGTEVTDLKDVSWSVDSVCVHTVTGADGTLTLAGRIDGNVTVGARVTYEEKTYEAETTVAVSGQSPKVYAMPVKLMTYGNALALHEEASSLGWKNAHGLAASSAENDYVHVLTAYLNERYGENHVSQVYGKYAENLEAIVATADKNTDFSASFRKVAAYVAEEKPDIVTVQYGEYLFACDSVAYENALTALVKEIRKGAPDAVIVLTTPFGAKRTSDAYSGAQSAAEALGLPLADLSAAAKDGLAAAASHTGVAKHPNDTGMAAIAKAVFSALNAGLTAKDRDSYAMLPESLTVADTVSITENEGTKLLEVTALPQGASEAFVYESADESVVSVSADGVLTARGNGETVVTVSARFAPNVKATCTVNVSGQSPTFALHFDKNANGTVKGMPVDKTSVKGEVILPNVFPERKGYLFSGWSETPDGEVIDRAAVTADKTVYAVWRKADAFTFETDGYAEGVTADNGFYPVVKDGRFSVTAVGTDVASGNVLKIRVPNLDIDPDAYDTLVVRLQNAATGSSAKLYLTVTTENGSVSYERTIANTSLSAYSFALDSLPGQITSLELIPTDIDTTVCIEDIQFLNASDSLLRYEANTDDAVSEMPSDEYFSESTQIPLSTAKPKRDGYLFLGWSYAPDSKLLVSDGSLIDSTKHDALYAVWDKEDHWECDTWCNEIDPQGMDSFAYTNGIFSYRSSGIGAMQNVKKLGYSTDSTAKKLKVRAKWQVASAEGLQAVAYIWTTRVPGFYDHLKLTADLSEYGAAPEDFVEFELDGSDNPNMTDDKILNIRFNILNKAGSCEVDYIRFADSEANVVVNDGETRKTASEDVTYIVKSSGTLAPVGMAVVNGLHLAGNLDLSQGILIVKGAFETNTSGNYKAYTLDMASADVTEADTMYVGTRSVPLYDGATYLFPEKETVRFRKLENTTGIELALSGEKTLYVGDGTETYTAKFSKELPDETLVWSVNRPGIASIDQNGVLTPKADGTVRITAVSAYNAAIRATFDVEIRYHAFTLAVSGEKNIRIDGKTRTYTAAVTGNIPDTHILWQTDNEKVASIDAQSGELTVHKPGTFHVIATSAYNPNVSVSYPVTAAYADFSIRIVGPDSILKDGRATSYTVQATGDVPENPVYYWSVDDTTLATVNEKGRLIPKNNGIVTLKAVSAYNKAVYDTKEITLSGQTGLFTVTYHAGTRGTVTGLPEPEAARGAFALSGQIPKRDGYIFLGWTADEQSSEVIYTVNVSKDTDVYALWGKGISYEFNGDAKGVTVSNGNVSVSPNGYLVCDTIGRDGDIRLIVDPFSVDPEAYRVVQMRMATDKKSFVQMFYKVEKTENGVTTRYGYDENGYRNAEDYCVYGEHKYVELDKWFDVQFNMYNTWRPGNPNWYMATADKVIGLWIDITNVPDATVYLDYLRILDVTRTVSYDSGTSDTVTGMPANKKTVFDTMYTVTGTPKREGYTFMGWSKDPHDMTARVSSFRVLDDVTLYALWVKNTALSEDKLSAFLGDIDCTETDAVLVKTTGGDNVLTLSFTGKNGETVLTAKTNALGYAYFDLSDETDVTGATVRAAQKSLVNVHAVTLAYAIRTATSVPDKPGNKGTGGSSVTEVEDVSSDKPEYAVGGETAKIEPFEGYKDVKEPILVNFDEDADLRFIETFGNIRNMGISGSVLSLRAEDFSNTYFETAKLSLDAASHRYVAVKIKKTTLDANVVRMYFLPEKENARYYTGNSEIRTISEDYQMLVFDMGAMREWSGTIDRLLFTFVGAAEGDFKIDWILLADELPEHYEDVEGEKTVFATVHRNPAVFADVAETAWYYTDVAKAYRIGMMNGVSETAFDPTGKVTIAQAITLAVRLNLRAGGQEEVFKAADGEAWYMPYIRTALEKHIIKDGEYADYEAYAVRRDVAQLLAKALPGSWFKKINYFTEIPDMDSKDDVNSSVLRLYNAGILTGFDSKYRFYPDTDIDRAQMAAMINRIAFEDSRKRVVTEAERNLLRRTFTAEEIKSAGVCESCATISLEVKNGFACNSSVGGDPIVYFMNLLDDLDKTLYSRIRIGMRWDRERMENPIPVGCQIFYTTPSSGWSGSQCVIPSWNGEVDENGVGEFVFDFDPKTKPFSSVKSFRLDPFDVANTDFAIAYIIVE